MIFLDLVKIYNVFYIMTMETLDRYKKMGAPEMQKGLVLYKNFCNFTDTLKKEANTIPMLFGFTFKEPNYYKPDINKERAMKKALKDKESGGGYDDDEDFGETVPEFEEQKNDFAEEDEKDDDEDSDDEYNFDILGDVKKQEQMASVHAGGRSRGKTQAAPKKERIVVDDFNTAALDDLLGAGEPKPQKSSTMGAFNDQDDEEWDPFAKKQDNVYSTTVPVQEVSAGRAQTMVANNNIFGDQDDMWGDNPVSNNQPTSKAQQKETLDHLLGGEEDDYQKGRSQTMAAPQNSDFDLLKNLYNTSTAAPASNMNMGNQPQQNYYNTGMPGAGYNNMGGGYNNNMGGYGAPQPGQFSTGYVGGYNDSGAGYNNYGGGQFNTGMAAGYNQNTNAGYGTGYGAQNTGYNTAAPSNQPNNGSDFDPFA